MGLLAIIDATKVMSVVCEKSGVEVETLLDVLKLYSLVVVYN